MPVGRLLPRARRKWIRCNRDHSIHAPVGEAAAIRRKRDRADAFPGIAQLLVIEELQCPIRNAPKLELALSSDSQVVTIRGKGDSLALIRQRRDLHPVRSPINARRPVGAGGYGEKRSVRRESGQETGEKSANKSAIWNVPHRYHYFARSGEQRVIR